MSFCQDLRSETVKICLPLEISPVHLSDRLFLSTILLTNDLSGHCPVLSYPVMRSGLAIFIAIKLSWTRVWSWRKSTPHPILLLHLTWLRITFSSSKVRHLSVGPEPWNLSPLQTSLWRVERGSLWKSAHILRLLNLPLSKSFTAF